MIISTYFNYIDTLINVSNKLITKYSINDDTGHLC